MKLKKWIIASIIFLMLIFIVTLLLGSTAINHLLAPQTESLIKLLSTHFFDTTLAIILVVNIFGIAVVLATFFGISRLADKLDDLDNAIDEAFRAKRMYENATIQLVRLQSNLSVDEAKILDKDIINDNTHNELNEHCPEPILKSSNCLTQDDYDSAFREYVNDFTNNKL